MTFASLTKPPRVSPYPWAALESLPRDVVGYLPAFRRAIRRAIDPRTLAVKIGEIIDAPIRFRTGRIEALAGPELPSLQGAAFVLSTSDERLRIGVEVDRELAAILVSKVLARPVGIMNPSRPLDPQIVGAVAAIVTTATRRANEGRLPLIPLGLGNLRLASGERAVRIHLSVIIKDEAHPATLTLPWLSPHTDDDASSPRLALRSLDHLPISLPLIAATSLATPRDIASLSVGDAFMPGSGWTVSAQGEALVGKALLAAAASHRGLSVALLPHGDIAVGRPCEALLEPLDMQNPDPDSESTAEAVLDAPVIVRVEVGSVTMTAREWANLAEGDVIAMGRRVAEPVILRVGGLEVARGELVDIEGELGVRIRERRGE